MLSFRTTSGGTYDQISDELRAAGFRPGDRVVLTKEPAEKPSGGKDCG